MIVFNIPEGTFNVSRNIPVATSQSVSVNEDVPAQLSLIGADIENIMDETATVQITQMPGHGEISSPEMDTITADYVTWIVTYTPDENYFGSDSLKYTVTNPNNPDGTVSNEGVILITVNPVNDIPVLATIPDQVMDEDTQLTVNLNYSDPDNDLVLIYTSSNPVKLTMSHVDNQLILQPIANYHGILSVIVTVAESSGEELQVSKTFTLTVNSVNDLPVMNPISDIEILEEQSAVITLSATDVDGVENFQYSAEITENLDLLQVSISDNLLTVTPAINMTGVGEISVWVDDGRDSGEFSDPAVFTVTVLNVNDAPSIALVITPDPLPEDGGSIEFTLIPMDVDEDDVLTAVISVTNIQLFPAGSATISPVSAESGVQRTVTLVPAANRSGTATVIITISDGSTTIGTQVPVIVLPVNDPPVIMPVNDLSLLEDTSGSLTINAADVEGSPLIYSLVGGVHISFTMNNNVFTFTPETNWSGTESFTVAVSDGDTFSASNFNVNVIPVNDAPIITSIANTIAYVSIPYTYQIQVSDVDQGSDPFAYQLTSNPAGMTITSAGLITWTPPLGVFSSGNVNVIATDDGGLTNSQSFVITVIQVDCNGEYNGTAIIDECSECVGGTTGLVFNYAMDCESVCFGSDFSAMDCAGICYGSSTVDLCGVCDENLANDNGTCTGCADPTAINFVEGNLVDDGSCVYLGDINGDQNVNVVDVIDMVNLIIYDTAPDEYEIMVGDMSGDGVIDIYDIVLLISTILGEENLGSMQPLQEGNLWITPEYLKLDGTGSVAAVDIQTRGEYTILNDLNRPVKIFEKDHRILIISLDGTELQNTHLFQFSGELSILSAMLYDWNGHSIQPYIAEIPSEFEITQIYPNPFNAETIIRFAIPEETTITLDIYDLRGRRVETLWEGPAPAGYSTVIWDAKSQSTGIYLISLRTSENVLTRKITLLK